MSGVACLVGAGNVVTGENDIIFMPRGGCRGRRPIFLFHGQLRPVGDWNNYVSAPGSTILGWALARAGFLVIAAYWSGPQWGNASFRAEVEFARTYATSLGASSDKFIALGVSMGAFESLSLAQHAPSEVAAAIGLIPAVDLDDFRDNDLANARSYINAAYGLPAGSTSATAPLPSDANVIKAENATQIISPIRLYGSSTDPYAKWSAVNTLVNRLTNSPDVAALDVSPGGGHSETTIAAAPVEDICKFVQAYAA